jgi:hypothetical protein
VVRFAALGSALALCALAVAAALALGGWGFVVVAVVFGAIALIGIHDVVQRRHSILRNYPILGHMRFAFEAIHPELQQYFIERNTDGRPFDRDSRTSIYERAKGIKDEQAYGTERDVRELDEAFAAPRPVLVDVVTNPDEVSLPPKVKPAQAWGFAIAKLTETLESRPS